MTQKSIRMLAVDEPSLTTSLDQAGYKKMGVTVLTSASFSEVQSSLADKSIDIVVINLDYSGVDGLATSKYIKGSAGFGQIPVVVTSVRDSNKIRNAANEAGADLFVEQPLPRHFFIEKLKKLLEHQTRLTERVEVLGEVKFEYDGKEYKCPVGDLSISGMLAASQLDLQSGTKLELSILLPESQRALKIDGEVVRRLEFSAQHPERPSGVGIRFVEFHGDARVKLNRFIEHSTMSDAKMVYYL